MSCQCCLCFSTIFTLSSLVSECKYSYKMWITATALDNPSPAPKEFLKCTFSLYYLCLVNHQTLHQLNHCIPHRICSPRIVSTLSSLMSSLIVLLSWLRHQWLNNCSSLLLIFCDKFHIYLSTFRVFVCLFCFYIYFLLVQLMNMETVSVIMSHCLLIC